MTLIENARQRGQRFWTSSILLLAQLLTVAPILLIVSTNERQSAQSERCVSLLQELDQLAVSIKELDSGVQQPRIGPEPYSKYRGDLDAILRNSAEIADVREIMLQTDAMVNRMRQVASAGAPANRDPAETDRLIAGYHKDGEAALHEVADAQRIVALRLSLAANGIREKEGYLKVLVAGACLLGVGVVFAFRGFRIDSATQRQLEQSLRSTNEEVLAALAAARDGAGAKNKLFINLGDAMRTPLNGVIGHATKLLETELTSEQREYAQGSLDGALSLASVIRDTVDFAKMEEGGADLEVEEFRPAKVTEDTLHTFRSQAERKGLKLESAIAGGLPELVKGDAGRLCQVLTNLIGNAIKFTEHGRVALSVTEVNRSDGRTRLRFEVRDTGIGIGEHALSRLFQPFSHADGSIARKYGGAGLGLAISKRLVELMGGGLDVASTPSGGSAFWFTVVLEHVPVRVITPVPVHGSRPDERDQRKEVRYRINYPTLLKSKAAGVAIVRVLDVADTGLRISVPFRLPLHTEVEIRIDDTVVSGFVRNCVCIRATEFHAGIEVLPSCSPEKHGLENFVNKRTVKRLMTARAVRTITAVEQSLAAAPLRDHQKLPC